MTAESEREAIAATTERMRSVGDLDERAEFEALRVSSGWLMTGRRAGLPAYRRYLDDEGRLYRVPDRCATGRTFEVFYPDAESRASLRI